MTRPWQLGATLADPSVEILLVCGAGGVGKTTTAAALALTAAEAGRRVAVITVDPAKRLATALGIDALTDEPTPVAGLDATAGGSLDAMMLDMKRAFDALVTARTSPERARALLDNPFYQALAESFGGTQEYIAMDRLGQLHSVGVRGPQPRWDLVVVDTPPSASALDFLDGPRRLARLLDSRLFQLVAAPARGGLRLLGGGLSIVQPLLTSLVGGRSLRDLQTFLMSAKDVLEALRERGDATRRVLSSPATACVVVTTPEQEPLSEAVALIDRLRDERVATAGLVINRARPDFGSPSATDGSPLERWLVARAQALHELNRQQTSRLARVAVGVATRNVEERTGEIVDLPELRSLGRLLTSEAAEGS